MPGIQSILSLTLALLLGAVLIQTVLAGDLGPKTGEGHMQTMVGTINEDARFEPPEGEAYLVVGKMAKHVDRRAGRKSKGIRYGSH